MVLSDGEPGGRPRRRLRRAGVPAIVFDFVLACVVIAIGVVPLIGIASDDSKRSVEVHATVEEVTARTAGPRGGTPTRVRFVTADGVRGVVEGKNAEVGAPIVIYRYESGKYRWDREVWTGERAWPWVPITIGTLMLVGAVRSAIKHRRAGPAEG